MIQNLLHCILAFLLLEMFRCRDFFVKQNRVKEGTFIWKFFKHKNYLYQLCYVITFWLVTFFVSLLMFIV